MASWAELLEQLNSLETPDEKTNWMRSSLRSAIERVAAIRGKPVIVYASAFLQKPYASLNTMMQREDINGFMASFHGLNCNNGISLFLHTPGGESGAAESIGDYLKSKCDSHGGFEVIVPTFAMSAGTMISLAATKIVMGRHSQLGPIDTQLSGIYRSGDRLVSARAVVSQFNAAVKDISTNRPNAYIWAHILPSLGPALFSEAKRALKHAQELVARWLETGVFQENPKAKRLAVKVAKYFNDEDDVHGFHGARIGLEEIQGLGLNVEPFEGDSDLQDAILTLYHLLTISFEHTPTVRYMMNSEGKTWIKNMPTPNIHTAS